MKRNFWILTVFTIVCVLLLQFGCEEQAKVTKPSEPTADSSQAINDTNGAGPEITFDKTSHHFGKMKPGTKSEYEFKFKNTGGKLLKIGKITPSCTSCTVAKLDKKEYLPGESGTLKVAYTSHQKSGRKRYAIYISSNDKANPKTKLDIRADVLRIVDYKPNKLKISFKQGKPVCADIILKSFDGTAFAITNFASTGGIITFDYDPQVEAEEFIIKPKIDAEKFQRVLKGDIKIGLTHPWRNLVVIPFEVIPEFSVTPSAISLLKVTPKKPIEREMWVVNNYGEEFEIEPVTSKKGFVKVLRQEKVEGSYRLDLQIVPPAKDGASTFSDTLYIQIKGGKKLEVACRAFYAE